jgi:hypothetical protein
MHSRRHLLILSTATAFGALLTGCAGKTESQLQTDVSLIANGLGNVLGTLKNIPGLNVPADVSAKIDAELAVIKSDASAIATALTPDANTVQAIADAVNAIYPLVTPFFPAAPAIAIAVQAALDLVPVILAAVGKSSASTRKAVYDPSTARLVLARFAS